MENNIKCIADYDDNVKVEEKLKTMENLQYERREVTLEKSCNDQKLCYICSDVISIGPYSIRRGNSLSIPHIDI